jgi:FkbM family methyltransferase
MIGRWLRKWNLRPFPDSITSLRAVRPSWSQFGEDLLVSNIVGLERTNGFYVDVGCFHPIRYSNSYVFYRRGWRGLCIDPSPVSSRFWKQYRPRDIVVNEAVGPAGANAKYLEFHERPQYNRLTFGEEIPPIEGGFVPDRVSPVTVRPLAEILESHLPENTVIDLLSIDCEGMDLEVLASNDFSRFRPRVMVVEDHDLSTQTTLTAFADSIGMKLVAQALVSKIFVDPSVELPFQEKALAT